MAIPSRTRTAVLSVLCALAATPAYAADGGNPGALKKDATSAPTAPAPDTSPVDTTAKGNGQGAQGGATTPSAETPAKTPITKGTVKKLAPQTQSTTGTSGSTTSGTTIGTTRTHRSTRSSSSATRSPTTRRSSARRATRAPAHRAAKRADSAKQPHDARDELPATASATAKEKRAAARAHERAAKKPKPKPKTDEKPVTGIASINRAADRVIEVIPGALILALAGLVALVLVLIARSWMMERRRGRALAESYTVTVQALATAIEAKDHTTGGHIERVRNLGLLLARELTPREARDPQMAYGFLLHDIGKLAIPDAILRSPGRLSEDEWALMRRHPEEGCRILSSIPFLDKAIDVVRYHHERWDGSGYPKGLKGLAIPLWARIFSVADALDAMTAERPYRARQAYALALEEIKRNAGTQFDPEVVKALERIDPAEVERLLEPAQVLDRTGDGDSAGLEPIEAILAASEAARVHAGDVAPTLPETVVANGNGNGRKRSHTHA